MKKCIDCAYFLNCKKANEEEVCKKYRYIQKNIEIKEGIEKGEIIDRDPEVISSEIFSLTSSCLIYKLKTEKNLDIQSMYKEIEKIAISGIMK